MDDQEVTSTQAIVFGIWIVTLCVAVLLYVIRMAQGELSVGPALESLSRVMAILTPQVTVMLVFFFGIPGEERRQIFDRHAGTVRLALVLSLVYHVVVWVCLTIAVFTTMLGDISESTTAVLQITGYFSALGVAPVAYLFTRQGFQGPGRKPADPPAQERSSPPK